MQPGPNCHRNLQRSLKETPATDLGAIVVRETLRARPRCGAIDTVVMGNVIQAGNRMNPARQAAIGGGLPVPVPALTVNRVCGSGAQAIASAALEIVAGYVDAAIAGGMENMDQAPYLVPGGRWGHRMGDAQILDSMLRDGLERCLLRRALRLAHRGSRHAAQSAARIRTAGRRARSSASPLRRPRASSTDEIVAIELRGKKGVELSPRTKRIGPRRRSRRSPS